MGAVNSKHITNAAVVATPFEGGDSKSTVTPEDVASWKKWDYIIVGGGRFAPIRFCSGLT